MKGTFCRPCRVPTNSSDWCKGEGTSRCPEPRLKSISIFPVPTDIWARNWSSVWRNDKAWNWFGTPFLLGAAFKHVGTAPFMNSPIKGEYAKRDLERTAREHGVPFNLCDVFVLKQVPASRAVCWANRNAQDKVAPLVHAIYRHAFVDGWNYSEPDVVADLAAGIGLDRDAVLAGMNDQTIKDALRDDVEAAMKRGVLGSPVFFFGDEPFWGVDHMEQLERWIKTWRLVKKRFRDLCVEGGMMSKKPIEFYFDFASPFAYIGSEDD